MPVFQQKRANIFQNRTQHLVLGKCHVVQTNRARARARARSRFRLISEILKYSDLYN